MEYFFNNPLVTASPGSEIQVHKHFAAPLHSLIPQLSIISYSLSILNSPGVSIKHPLPVHCLRPLDNSLKTDCLQCCRQLVYTSVDRLSSMLQTACLHFCRQPVCKLKACQATKTKALTAKSNSPKAVYSAPGHLWTPQHLSVFEKADSVHFSVM